MSAGSRARAKLLQLDRCGLHSVAHHQTPQELSHLAGAL